MNAKQHVDGSMRTAGGEKGASTPKDARRETKQSKQHRVGLPQMREKTKQHEPKKKLRYRFCAFVSEKRSSSAKKTTRLYKNAPARSTMIHGETAVHIEHFTRQWFLERVCVWVPIKNIVYYHENLSRARMKH